MPLRAAVVFVDRPTCATPGCTRVPAVKTCTRIMCKICCEIKAGRCGCVGHDKTRGKLEMATTAALYQAGSTSQNPFALSRPPAALPPLPLNHTIPAAPVALPVNLAQSSGDGWDNAVLDPALLNTTTPASTQVSVPTQATGTQPSQAIPEGPPSSIRSFVKRMPPQFKAQWDAARAEEDRRILSEDIVRRNKEKFHHAVTFKQWVSDGEPPQRHTLQGFPGWPYLALADHADLLNKLGLTATDRVQIYNVRYRRWEECDTTETRQVTPKDTLLMRNIGVTDCPEFDELLDELTGRTGSLRDSVPPVHVTVVTPRSQRTSKRPRPADLEPVDRTPSTARHSVAHTSPMRFTRADSPAGSCASSDAGFSSQTRSPMTPSLALRLPHLTPATSTAPSSIPSSVSHDSFLALSAYSGLSGAVSGLGLLGVDLAPGPSSGALPAVIVHGTGDGLEQDWIWQFKRVYVKPQARFPGDIYARDMAQALTWLVEYRGKDIEEHFKKVFPGIRFVSQTYYTQASIWKGCSETDRNWLRSQPRTPAGLWSACRKKLEEWQAKGSHH